LHSDCFNFSDWGKQNDNPFGGYRCIGRRFSFLFYFGENLILICFTGMGTDDVPNNGIWEQG
jgi:hypothetical protein